LECSYIFPDHAYQHVDMGFGSWAIGNDGDTLWVRKNSGSATTGDSEDSASIFSDLYFDGYLYLLDQKIYGHYELRHDTVIDGRKHYQLAMFPRFGDSTHAYIDAESGRMDCIRYFNPRHQVLSFRFDFRKVAGVERAFQHRSELVGTGHSLVYKITDIKINEAIPDSIFSMPDPKLAKSRYRFIGGNDSALVKFKMKKSWVIVAARINGTKKCHFLLDTGASGCLITQKLAKKLALETIGSTSTNGIAGDVVFKFAPVDSIEMGELVWYPSRLEVLYGNEETGDLFRSIDGLLGYDFFMDFPMRIDFDKKRIVLYADDSADVAGAGTPVSIDLSHHAAGKEMSLDGRPIRMIIDLGANFELFLYSNYRWFYKLADDLRFDPADMESFGIGGHRSIKAGSADSLKFDGVFVSHPEVYIAPRPEGFTEIGGVEGLLGAEILTRYNLLIDYPDSKIYFEERQPKK